MIVFTVPKSYKVGSDKVFMSAKEITGFVVHKYDRRDAIKATVEVVRQGWSSIHDYEIPYPDSETAEKYTREAIKAIVYDEDYEFPIFKG